jgi:hypothetical protein
LNDILIRLGNWKSPYFECCVWIRGWNFIHNLNMKGILLLAFLSIFGTCSKLLIRKVHRHRHGFTWRGQLFLYFGLHHKDAWPFPPTPH